MNTAFLLVLLLDYFHKC